MLKLVFMGTPEFAVVSLEALARTEHQILAVYTQPDRPAGRGRKLSAPPVKRKALELGLEIEQPKSVKRAAVFEALERLNPDVIVVVGYGRIIPQTILDLPSHGCVNVHSSLLPKYRGAAPINWALVQGETETGVSTMKLVQELDAGDVLKTRKTAIGEDEYAPALTARLATMGAALLLETLGEIEAGATTPRPQDHESVSYAPIMKREDGLIDWTLSAREIYNRVRGFDPWPGAYTFFRGKRLHIRRAKPAERPGLEPGVLATDGDRLLIGCGGDALEGLEVQPEGKRRMSAADFVHGYQPRGEEALAQGPTTQGETDR